MDSLSVIIAKKAYTNLIFDLRGKNSPNPCSANILVGYLSDKAFNAGIYLTRKWFDGNMIVPKSSEYKKMFKGFNDAGYQADEFYKEQGRFLDVVPVTKSFKGKVYVLTDSKTSRVAEAMVYILKKEKIATIVGQKTAGASMLYEHILIINGYEIYLPVSDYFTSEGKSLNKIGIEPDIPVSGDDAMKYVLKVL